MSTFNNLFGNLFGEETNWYTKIEVMCRKREFEETLDAMWANYGRGVISQLPEYQKQINSIKTAGCKVMRNSAGRHKIITK